MGKFKPNTASDHARTPKSMRSSLKLSEVKNVEITSLRMNPSNTEYFQQESSEYFARLTEDIQERGIIVPLIAKRDGTLLAGHNRLTVAEKLNLLVVPVQYVELPLSEEEERAFVIKDNLLRRHLGASEWIEVYRKLFPDFDATFINEETKAKSGRAKNGEERLTIAKIAEETGQKSDTVKKQITRFREKNGEAANGKSHDEKKGDNVTFSEKNGYGGELHEKKGDNVTFSEQDMRLLKTVEQFRSLFEKAGEQAQKKALENLRGLLEAV